MRSLGFLRLMAGDIATETETETRADNSDSYKNTHKTLTYKYINMHIYWRT